VPAVKSEQTLVNFFSNFISKFDISEQYCGSLSGFVRIRIIFPDPYNFPGSGSVPICFGFESRSWSYSTKHIKINCNGRWNNVCLLFSRPIYKENQVKIFNIKKCCFRCIYLFETARIWIRIKKSDPDASQSEKPVPDPYKIFWIRNTVSWFIVSVVAELFDLRP
jgi:hypothetical protein